MKYTCYYSNNPFINCCTAGEIQWYYGGSFVDGEKNRILVFNIRTIDREHLGGFGEFLHTANINIGRSPKFPLVLDCNSTLINIIGPTDEHWNAIRISKD